MRLSDPLCLHYSAVLPPRCLGHFLLFPALYLCLLIILRNRSRYAFSGGINRFAERKKLLHSVGNPPGQLSPHIGKGVFKPQCQSPLKIFQSDSLGA